MHTDSKPLGKSEFWDAYAARVRARGVPEADIPVYVEWAQGFAMSQRGALRDRKATDVPSSGSVRDLAPL